MAKSSKTEIRLVVISPFDNYQKGDVIENTQEAETILNSDKCNYVQKTLKQE